MISFEEAFKIVLENCGAFGEEIVPLEESSGRVLAEDVTADRDFPPFNRSTKDGIAITFSSWEAGNSSFTIQGIAAAGTPQMKLQNDSSCVEIMTGAMVPAGADTVVMYEHLKVEDGHATVLNPIRWGQNIHTKGSDTEKGTVVLEKGTKIGPSVIGVLASVGKTKVLVKKLPKIAVVSTGNE